MKKSLFLILTALVIVFGVTACGTAQNQPASQTPPATTQSTGATTGTTQTIDQRVAALENFQKTFPEGTRWWMFQLQDSLSRAWFDAQAGNWDLASFDTNEIKGIDKSLINTRTKFKDQMTGYETAYLTPLADAASKKDTAAFTAAYDKAVAGCNACHVANVENNVSFGMIKITRPTSNPVGNQDFAGAK